MPRAAEKGQNCKLSTQSLGLAGVRTPRGAAGPETQRILFL